MMPKVIHLLVLIIVSCLIAGCTLGAPAIKLKDSVIAGDVIWRGEVLIDGIVTVKKTGRLVIQPGTVVRFVARDVDGDGIGDAELMVEGTLLAKGTADSPIIFTSAEKNPQPADWKYLYLDFARPSEIAHVISEYAYSGLQIHFSRATVTDSVFRNNVDGLRFSTVNLMVAGNLMHDNRHGLRYEERNSKAQIYNNEIRDNEIGVFVVTRSEDKARIERNNIFDNRQYNVKLGWQQPGDVTLANNWWGTSVVQEIKKTFMDSQVDSSLGTVYVTDPLTGPVHVDDWQQ